jgi:flagellar hook-associated protein 1 FlgK
MVSAFFGLNTGLRALIASQLALDTAAHNSANAATDGYSRQRVGLVASEPYPYPSFYGSGGLPGQVGTGVSAVTIMRVRDAFVDLQLRQETSRSGAWTTRSDELGRLQDVFPEPGTSGLGASLSRFWNAWQDLAADPASSAARSAVLQQAAGLATDLNRAAGQVSAITNAENEAVKQGVDQVNAIASQIAALNTQIRLVTATGDQANDLADQRDMLFDKLTALVPVTFEPQRDGTVKVIVGGTDLVNGDKARTLTGVAGPNGNVVPTWSGGGAVALGEAQLGQLVRLRDTDVPAYLARLDALASGIASAVNSLHQSGYDLDGNAGLALFASSNGSPISASTISLNPALAGKPRLVAAASAPGQLGNGSVAGAIADLQSSASLAGRSPADFYAAIVGDLGADTANANTMQQNQDLVVEHLKTRRESLSGVSLDEEATDMVRFQHMYQAAARVITVMDQNLDTLINSMGMVGR